MRIWHEIQAGHSVRVRPNPFPNLEVKPNVAVVLLRCESPWEATVLAFSTSNQSFNIVCPSMRLLPNCSVCGEIFSDDIRFLNHMMENTDSEIQMLENQTETVVDISFINFANNLELVLPQIQLPLLDCMFFLWLQFVSMLLLQYLDGPRVFFL